MTPHKLITLEATADVCRRIYLAILKEIGDQDRLAARPFSTTHAKIAARLLREKCLIAARDLNEANAAVARARGGRQWNVATDMAINEEVQAALKPGRI